MRGGDGQGEPMGFVVRRMVCDFKRPALIDDVLEVRSRLAGLSGARMEIAQKIMRGADELFTAQVTAALVNTKSGRPLRFPPDMRAVMEKLLGEE
jgi:acyl-CoA thioester hydrolase